MGARAAARPRTERYSVVEGVLVDALHDRGWAHARTLHGAIDAHLATLVHNQPWLVDTRAAALERLAAAWAAEHGPNWLPSLRAIWVSRHLLALPESRRPGDAVAVAELLRWAVAEGLADPQWEALLPGPGTAGHLLP